MEIIVLLTMLVERPILAASQPSGRLKRAGKAGCRLKALHHARQALGCGIAENHAG